MAKRETPEIIRVRDSSHLIYYLSCKIRRIIRVELRPDLTRWYNQSARMVDACFRVILSLMISILEILLVILRKMRDTCQPTSVESLLREERESTEIRILEDLIT